jgi:DNA-directed RNA polymerase subunit F
VSRRALKENSITIPQVKEKLEAIGEEKLDQFQRRTLDYASKFSKVDARASEELVNNLVTQFGLEEQEAVQIVNCLPESVEEIRIFLAGGRKIVETAKIEAILSFLNTHRKKE